MPQMTLYYSSQEAAESEASQHLATLEKPFKCTECDSSFTTNAALNIHSKTHIRGQKLKCSLCTFVTNDYNELRKHRLNDTCRGKQQLFRCHACDFICHSKPMMKTHFFSAHTDPDKLHECPDCDFKALKINALNIHIKQQHSAPMEYACTSCDFVCNSQSVIKNHIIKRHSDENLGIDGEQEGEEEVEQEEVTNINKYACASCDYMCSSMAQIKTHIADFHSTDSPIKSTNLQGGEEPLDPNLEKVKIKKNLPNIIEPMRYTKGPLSTNVPFSLNTNAPFVRKYSCRECDFTCLKKRGIDVHMSRVHKFTENAPPKMDKLKIKHVDYVLEPIPIGHHPPAPANGEKINSHDERRMYKCPLCKFKGTLFGFKIHRNNHMSWKCKTCGAKCKSEASLLKHMKAHEGYSCKLCDFHCETDLGFQSHMDLVHNKAAKRFSCPKCHYKCNTQMDLRRHVAVHEPQKQFTCPECEDSYDEKSELMHHMLSMNHTGGKPFPCTKCKAQFLTDAGLKIHLESHDPEPESGELYSDEEYAYSEEEYDEDEYGDRVESKSPRKVLNDLDEDYIYDGEDEEDEELEPDDWLYEGRANAKKERRKHLRCFYGTCEFRSHSFLGLQIHVKSHNESENEKKVKLCCAHLACEYTAITIKGMLLHIKMIHQNFEGEENSEEADFTPISETESGEKVMKCPKCKFIGTSKALSMHAKLHMEPRPRPIKIKADSSSFNISFEEELGTQKCPDCEYVGTAKGLKVHSRMHLIVKPYGCKECDFSCNTQAVLDTHVSRKHGTDEFACKECDYRGSSRLGYLRHYSKMHTQHTDKENSSEQEKEVNSDSQNSTEVNNEDNEKENKNADGDDENRKFRCPTGSCDFEGSTRQELSKHLLRTHITIKVPQPKPENDAKDSEKGADKKSYACEQCDYIGNYRGYKGHLKVHSKDIFSCTECDFTCLKKGALDAHIKKKHNKKKCKVCDYVGSAKGLKSHSKAHTREKSFVCKECDFKCLTQKVLDTHIQRLHGTNEFACSMCNYKGTSAQGLNIHSMKAHYVKAPINNPKSNNEPCAKDNEENSPDNESTVENEESSSRKEPNNESEENSSQKKSNVENKEDINSKNKPFIESEETSTKKKSDLENKEDINSKNKPLIESEENSSQKKPKLENKLDKNTKDKPSFDDKENAAAKSGSEKNKDSVVDDSQETPGKAKSEKRIRQVNQKYNNKDYVLEGSTPKRDNTERQSKRLKTDDKEKNDDNEDGSLNKSASQESLKKVKTQPESKEEPGNISSAPESDSTPSRPKRIKLARNNTPGNANDKKELEKKDTNNKKELQKKDNVKKVSPNEEGTSKKVNKPEGKKVQSATITREKRKNNDESEGEKVGSVNKKRQGKDVQSKESPGKAVFQQNADKKKKFDEYMKAQANKVNGATPDRKNIKRDKGLTCLCLECGARFTTKNALEKHMITHI